MRKDAVDGVIVKAPDLLPWVRHLLATRRVVAPVKGADGVVWYRPVTAEDVPVLEGPRPTRAPKEHFIPQTETLLTFSGSGEALSLRPAAPDGAATVVFGVRPCDARAISRLDDVFLGRRGTDEHYASRRAAAALVGIACQTPSWGCFCTSVGGGPGGREGLDLLLTDLGDRYHVAVVTEKGRALLDGATWTAAEDAETGLAEARHADAAARMPVRFDLDAVAGRVAWESPVWASHAKRCLACGVCSFLCPACHCFDIQDETTAEGGLRFRCWDTCQFGEFTQMGAGHNPRPSQKERLRQRLSHKLKYLVEEFGRPGCTGCGRCVELCPVNIDIRTILDELGARRDE
jgi:sulfhydrogenase subunit beta (sulfur reductase)